MASLDPKTLATLTFTVILVAVSLVVGAQLFDDVISDLNANQSPSMSNINGTGGVIAKLVVPIGYGLMLSALPIVFALKTLGKL